MAKNNKSGRPPQARHKDSKPSQHDKRQRLVTPNENREKTDGASIPLTGGILKLVTAMCGMLDARIAFRLPIIIAGAMLAGGRRTASNWFRCAGVKDDWDRFYDLLESIGRNAATVMHPLLRFIVQKFDPGPEGYWKFLVDDSPTRRFGPCVEAANIHHNPTPGPGDGNWLYGHNWVALALALRHPIFGVIAIPLLSHLYVRKANIDQLKERYGWKFRTKHELALDLCCQIMTRLKALGSQTRCMIIFDGAYMAGALVRPLIEAGATVVTRLRSDAKLWDQPVNKVGQRGRPRKYGKNRISLKNKAKNKQGWQMITYLSRGVKTEGRYKTFLATSEVVGGEVRVVLLEHASGNWAAYISTDPKMSVEQILEAVSDRWSIEEQFHDVKEIWGAGEQQVRNVWSSVGCWNLCGWLFALVELECWDDKSDKLVDRSDRPWDNPQRRPSHNDRRRKIRREMLSKRFSVDLESELDNAKILHQFEQLIALAV